MRRLPPIAILFLLLLWGTATASDRDLELPGNWFGDRVDWRVSLGLPTDSEFTAPLVAQYNWAYGSTVLGVNVREFGTHRYFATVAGFSDGRLDIYDSVGPLGRAAVYKAGPYHVSAGLDDGRVLCWLTAPGEFPRSLVLVNNYLPTSGFDVVVEPPDPPGSNWEDWTVVLSYQANVAGNNIVTVVLNGNGELLYDLPGLEMDGVVRELEYARRPLPGLDMPYLLMVVEYGDSGSGGILRKATGTAWFDPDQGWFTQGIRATGRSNSSVYLDADTAGGALAMMAWDASDEYQNTSYIERLHLRLGSSGQVLTDTGLPNLVNRFTTNVNWCFGKTVANRFPYVLFSDGTDVLFGYNASRRGEQGRDVGYKTFVLVRGQLAGDEYGNEGPLYPVEGVAMSTHWNTGDPLVFFIQQGSADYAGGQLYHLQYISPAKAGGG